MSSSSLLVGDSLDCQNPTMASYQRTDVGDVESKPKAKSTPKSGLGQNPLFEISWRLALVVSFGASLAVVLYMFQQKGRLSSDERRWFNALTLLFTALISLSVGSLLGLLGTMIRWPLLAERAHSPQDVSRDSSYVKTDGILIASFFERRSIIFWECQKRQERSGLSGFTALGPRSGRLRRWWPWYICW